MSTPKRKVKKKATGGSIGSPSAIPSPRPSPSRSIKSPKSLNSSKKKKVVKKKKASDSLDKGRTGDGDDQSFPVAIAGTADIVRNSNDSSLMSLSILSTSREESMEILPPPPTDESGRSSKTRRSMGRSTMSSLAYSPSTKSTAKSIKISTTAKEAAEAKQSKSSPTVSGAVGVSTEKLSSLMSFLDGMESGNPASVQSPQRSVNTKSTTLSFRSMVREGRKDIGREEKLVRDSVAPGKKWIWDDWGADDANSRSVIDDNTEESRYLSVLAGEESFNAPIDGKDSSDRDADSDSRNNNVSTINTSTITDKYNDEDFSIDDSHNPPLSSLTQATTTSTHNQIKQKIQAMRGELEEKRQEVIALKASIARKTSSHSRVRKQIEESWEERIRKRREEARQTKRRQEEFAERLEKDCEMIIKRKAGLEEVLHYRLESRTATVDTAKKEVEKAMKLERENWLQAERIRLERLADAKSQDLKKDAVKALEPELERLLSGNKLDLKQRREEAEEMFEAFKNERKREAQIALGEEKRRLENEALEESEKIRSQQSIRLLQTAESHEQDLKSARELWNREMESERQKFESERKRRNNTYASELAELREIEGERLAEMSRAHEQEMKSIHEKREFAIAEKQRQNAAANENWQRLRLEEIREDVEKRELTQIKALREQSNAELEMVLSRLEAQSANEVQGINDDGKMNLETKKSEYDKEKEKIKEEEAVMMSRFALEKEKEEISREECNLLNSRVTAMERRVASSEENLKKEKSRLSLLTAECEEKINRVKHGRARGVELLEHQLKNLQLQVDDLTVTLVDTRPLHQAEYAKLEKKNREEIESVEIRVATIIEAKEDLLRKKEFEYKEVCNEAQHRLNELDVLRKQDLETL